MLKNNLQYGDNKVRYKGCKDKNGLVGRDQLNLRKQEKMAEN